MTRAWLLVSANLGLVVSTVLAQPQPTTPNEASVDLTNLSNCLRGAVGCDVSLLSPGDLAKVSAESKKRNLDYCLAGTVLCDPTRLTTAESASVRAARFRRNQEKCAAGAAACNPMLLDSKGQAAAA